MFGIGGFELFLIALFGFLIFGPDKLPQLAKTVGYAIQKFRSAQDEVNKVVKTEIYDPLSKDPTKNPLDAMTRENHQKVEGKESFAARKAKYDREREDRRKREAANAAAQEARDAVKAEAAEAREAAKAAQEEGESVQAANLSASQVHDRVMAARKQAAEKAVADAQAERAAKQDLADEIFGAKAPVVKKPAALADKEEN